jgi:hypothetical protein
VEKDPQEILEGRIIPDTEKERVQLYQEDPVSGSPVSEIKEVLVDLDRSIEDSSLEYLLTPTELAKVKAERERRMRMSGPNNSVISG